MILIAGGSLALASPANDAKVHVGDFSVSFNDDESDLTFCPPHTTATGGGFGTVTQPPLSVAQALVVCSKSVKPHIVADKVPVAPSSDVEVAANCPLGQRALGGGVLIQGRLSSRLQFVENGPLSSAGTTAGTIDRHVPVAWDGDIDNGTERTSTFKTLAVCA